VIASAGHEQDAGGIRELLLVRQHVVQPVRLQPDRLAVIDRDHALRRIRRSVGDGTVPQQERG
jgi:hypothetical protein